MNAEQQVKIEVLQSIRHSMRSNIDTLSVSMVVLERELSKNISHSDENRLKGIIQSMNATIEALRHNSDEMRDVYRDPMSKVSKFNLFTLVEEAKRTIENRLVETNIKFSNKTDKEICLEGKYDEFTYVLLNLFLNSISSLRTGTNVTQPLISVSSRIVGDQIKIIVEDNGPNIGAIGPSELDEQWTSRIFEAGFVGNRAATARGSGFGLYVAKKVVEGHSGSIAAKFDTNFQIIISLPASKMKLNDEK